MNDLKLKVENEVVWGVNRTVIPIRSPDRTHFINFRMLGHTGPKYTGFDFTCTVWSLYHSNGQRRQFWYLRGNMMLWEGTWHYSANSVVSFFLLWLGRYADGEERVVCFYFPRPAAVISVSWHAGWFSREPDYSSRGMLPQFTQICN